MGGMNFQEMGFDDALRFFLSAFWLPGEAQKIDRIVERFARKYVQNNPGVSCFPSIEGYGMVCS